MKRLFLLPTLLMISLFSLSFTRAIPADEDKEKSLDKDTAAVADSILNDSIIAVDDSIAAIADSILSALFPRIEPITLDSTRVQPQLPGRSFSPTTDIVNPVVPNTVTIDTSKPVGEIPINSGVSPTGGKTYEIPIEIAPGMNGFQPSISLSYNSQQGNSEVGMGWSISGLSRIERTSQNIYYDGKTQGVEMKNTDAFVLDGVRLINLSQESDHILYESEIGHIKVKGYISGNVMLYFEVFYPDGRKGVYGETSNTTNLTAYPVTSSTDLWGNSITYTYLYWDNHPYIYTIHYNDCSIRFEYTSTRPDELESYSCGVKESVNWLLSSITSRRGSTSLRTYSLTYSSSNGPSFLTQLDCSSSSSSLNPLRFYYGNGSTGYSYNITPVIINSYYPSDCQNNIKTVIGKFDYENNADGLLVMPNLLSYYQHYTTSNKSFENAYLGTESIYLYTGANDSYDCYNYQLTAEAGFADILCADLEGKQQEYIIKINNSVVNNQDQIVFKVYKTSCTAELILLCTRTYSFSTVYSYNGHKSVQPKSYYAGDFNGDGKMEIMAISTHQPFGDTTKPSKCYIFDLINNQIVFQSHILDFHQTFLGDLQTDPTTADNNSDKLLVMDFDGDGKDDLFHINSSSTDLYTFEENNGSYSAHQVSTYGALNRVCFAYRKWGIGDFNGDGLKDILTSPSSQSSSNLWSIYKNQGDGGYSTSYFEGPYYSGDDCTRVIVHDVNGDGKSDFLDCNAEGAYTYLCKNNTFDAYASFVFFNPDSVRVLPLVMTSRNSFTQLIGLKDQQLFKYQFQRDERKEQLLTGMANSIGIIEKNEYLYQLGEEASAMTPSQSYQYSPNYPYITLHEPMPLLYRSEKYLNGSKFDMDRYGYGEAVSHRQGLGFRGFTAFSRNDYRNDVYNQTFDVERRSVPIQEITPRKQTDFTYSVVVDNNKIAHVKLTEKEEYDQVRGVSSNTEYTYNSYEYPISETITYNNSNIVIHKSNSYSNNTIFGDGYYLGYPTTESTTTSDGNENYTETMVSTHLHCQPLDRTYYVNGNRVNKESFAYDSNGNKTSETVYPYYSTDGSQTSFTYDSYGLLSSKTDPLGVTYSYSYDNKGRISKIEDTNGDIDQYIYNAFGRITRILHNNSPNRVTNYYSYQWSTKAPNAVYRVYHYETGKSTKYTYYDALNREVRFSEQRFDGIYRHIDKTYDSYGRLSAASLPFKGTSATYWNNYYYDYYDRITAFAEASGHATTYSYNGLSKTTTEDGITTTRTFDVLGRLISSTDPVGTVTYDLAADGQPNSITAPGNVSILFSYNERRKRTQMVDPSAGTTNYSYDTKGHIYQTTDARGQSIYYFYDQPGRLIRTEYPEFTVNRTYNSRNQLISVISTNGISKEMTYDVNGRLSTWKETVDSVWLQKSYTYSNNHVSHINYSSQSGLYIGECYTYANGHLTEVTMNGTSQMFKLLQENDLGQPTQVITKGLTRTYSYTPTGIPTGRSAASTQFTLQDESYNFDPSTSNLLSKTDNIRNLSDYFQYDSMNRLVMSNGASVQYDTKGNILSKSDIGSFSYDNTQKPYAVTGTSAVSGTLSNNTQSISYYSFPRPNTISENPYTVTFTYDGELEKVKKVVRKNGIVTETRYSLGDCYDYVITSNNNNITKEEDLYFFGGYYNAPILLRRNNGSNNMSENLLIRDYQGSVTCIAEATHYWHSDYSYDAWGRLRNPSTHVVYSYNQLVSNSPSLRGYCGHEHLPQFGLINMNARLYDPITSRFLSPDPYVQSPENSQNFNRYSYCLNNPTKYTDPSGELFIIDDWIIGFFKGIKHKPFRSANRHATNSMKIWAGLFTLDGNKNFGEKTWELVSRFTWQLPQTSLGFFFAHGNNMIGNVQNVRHLYGTTVLSSSFFHGEEAMTIGSYITGSHKIKADASNSTFQHEYGHYIQSQKYGIAYLTAVGVHSLKSAKNHDDHNNQPYEIDANDRANAYFTKHIDNFVWDPKHPLSSSNKSGYVPDKWYDYLFGSSFMPFTGLGLFHSGTIFVNQTGLIY